jgi:hypothetical protein
VITTCAQHLLLLVPAASARIVVLPLVVPLLVPLLELALRNSDTLHPSLQLPLLGAMSILTLAEELVRSFSTRMEVESRWTILIRVRKLYMKFLMRSRLRTIPLGIKPKRYPRARGKELLVLFFYFLFSILVMVIGFDLPHPLPFNEKAIHFFLIQKQTREILFHC